MVECEEEQPAFEIAVVVPKRSNVKEEDESSECVEVLVHDFQNVGLLVERVLGVADQCIKLGTPLETLGRAAARLQIKKRTRIGVDLQFEWEEAEAFVRQPEIVV